MNMAKITTDALRVTLEELGADSPSSEVAVADDIARGARLALERMIRFVESNR